MTVNMLGKIDIWSISRFIGSYICMIFLDAYSVLALISRVVSCGYILANTALSVCFSRGAL